MGWGYSGSWSAALWRSSTRGGEPAGLCESAKESIGFTSVTEWQPVRNFPVKIALCVCLVAVRSVDEVQSLDLICPAASAKLPSCRKFPS